jgi:hypothetical protein
MFSSRLPATLAPNLVSQAVAALRRSGVPLLDLTETNPTVVGLPYPDDVLAPLSDARARVYAPDPRGLADARAAIAEDYAPRATVSPDRIVLTSSSSEAYASLFKVLCNAGESVLVPHPSYPLFELLTGLEGVDARPYALEYHGVWSIDRDSLEQAIDARARAVLVVSPNNPTGSMLRSDDREWLVALCARRGLAIISDEVFAGYPLAPRADASSFVGESRTLNFVLGGLSKSAGLPQVKLGWMLVDGPAALVTDALERLELVADTYLSVSTPVQVAAARLITSGGGIRAAIAARLRENLDALRRAVAVHPAITLRDPEGGWSAVLEVPATMSDEALVLRILDEHVLVHPGYFFDFTRGAFLVVSLLPRPDVFREAIARALPIASGGGS